MRLRFAWGGAQRTTWSGSISIDRGQFSELAILGIESDVPACVWLDRNAVQIREGAAGDYGGVDVTVTAPEDARLIIRLRSGTAETESTTEATYGMLVAGNHRAVLDGAGNYLLITRAPGDRLRVTLDRPHVIYAPGDAISLRAQVSPELLTNQQSFELVAEVTGARGGEPLHEQKSNVTRDELLQKPLTVPLPAPNEEGVYEARLILRRQPGLRERIVPGTPPIVERRIQFVVFDPTSKSSAPAIEWQETASIDLANPNWAARLPQWWGFQHIPGVPARLPSNVALSSEMVLGRSALILPGPQPEQERAWCAVPLSVAAPGEPYLISIELPAGLPNQVGLSILEPNAAGFVYPITRDFGVFSRPDDSDERNAWQTKSFLVWPKSESPILLLSNEHPTAAAFVGTVRLYGSHVGQGRHAESLPSEDRRIAAVMVDRPWLVESLGAREALDAANNQSVDDWQTFYDAAVRLVDYVQLGGYNAAVLSVFADGSAIYPSKILQSTPRYDTGILASAAPDPVRKDFVELLLSAFDRAGLFAYAALEFSSPLPELERRRRATSSQESGIEWIGADGRSWAEHRGSMGGAAPHYNLLNEQVQDAMLRVVRELVARYDSHRSLAGVALQLSGSGYAQLLEPSWGFDDATVQRFEQDTNIEVPGNGPQRFAVRAEFLLGVKRKEWIEWRAAVASRFYARVRDEVRSEERLRELLLLPNRLFERAETRARLRPSLIARSNLAQELYELGLDAPTLAEEDEIVLLRPSFDVTPSPLGHFAAEHGVNASSEIDSALGKGIAAGEVLSFPSLTHNRRLTSFDLQNHFGDGKSFTAPLTQMRSMGDERRRPLARALAARDIALFVEGGQTLVTEMDDDQRRALEIFRMLPSGNCETTVQRPQPVTIRTYRTEHDLFVCLVNESAWTHQATILIEAPEGSQLLELGAPRGPQTVAGNPALFEWQVTLSAYGIHAARISSAGARIVKTTVEPSSEMQRELKRRLADLNDRAQQIGEDRPLTVLENPSFETVGSADEIPAWQVFNPQGGYVELSQDRPSEAGAYSASVTSIGPPVSLTSQAFAAPATGRLALSAFIRRSDASEEILVRMFIEDAQGGRRYGRHGALSGRGIRGTGRLATEWGRQGYRVPFDDVPMETPFPLRVRFEVSGKGTVWIDNVQLSALSFRTAPIGTRSQPDEQLELYKIILGAQKAFDEGAYSDCLESLDGYWPRFLNAHVKVPAPSVRLAETPLDSANSVETQEATSPSMPDRIKQFVVPRFFK